MTISKKRVTVLACSVALAALAGSAAARPVHHQIQAVRAAQADVADRDMRYSASTAQADAGTAVQGGRHGGRHRARRQTAAEAAQSHTNSAYGGSTSNSLVAQARKYIGTNPTGRGSLWCGAFMDLVLKQTGHAGGGNLAWGYSRYGTRVAGPQVGAIAVMHGHVGVVSGIDANGNPIIVSGNHNHTVAEAVYPRSRISAYVMP